jgi:hypothetical protein
MYWPPEAPEQWDAIWLGRSGDCYGAVLIGVAKAMIFAVKHATRNAVMLGYVRLQ